MIEFIAAVAAVLAVLVLFDGLAIIYGADSRHSNGRDLLR
jgi:hypothetical protein